MEHMTKVSWHKFGQILKLAFLKMLIILHIILPLSNLVVRKIRCSCWILATIEHFSTCIEQSSQYVMEFVFFFSAKLDTRECTSDVQGHM